MITAECAAGCECRCLLPLLAEGPEGEGDSKWVAHQPSPHTGPRKCSASGRTSKGFVVAEQGQIGPPLSFLPLVCRRSAFGTSPFRG